MDYASVLGGILAVHALAIISPGPNFLVVTQTAISQTRRAGIAAALGIATGAAVWSSSVVLGLSVVFAYFAWLHYAIRLLGGMYLVYLGVRLWSATSQPLNPSENDGTTLRTNWAAFQLGLITNLTNPKAVVFYGSIFAAFLDPDLPTWVKVAAVGIIFVNSTGWHVAFACLFSTPRAQQVYARFKRWIDRAAGTALALLGLRLILQGR